MTVLPLSHATLSRVFDTAHLVLTTNLLLVASCLPVVLVLLTTDPARSWGLLAVVLPLLAPAFTAASVVFADFSDHGGGAVLRTFTGAWRAHLRRSLGVGATATVVLVVIATDIRSCRMG